MSKYMIEHNYIITVTKVLRRFFVSDAATIIIVNLYIRSFAKIDDVKMVSLYLVIDEYYTTTFVMQK